jgi:hypothetical protein
LSEVELEQLITADKGEEQEGTMKIKQNYSLQHQ